MAVKDFSTTPGSNASVGSINFAEGQAANTVNNSARQLMADIKDGVVVTVTNHAAMTALTKANQADDSVVECLGKTTVGDGLGGLFYWDSASAATADAETVLAADEGGTGRWIKIRGAYKSAQVIVSDPTATSEGATLGIGNEKSFPYRVTGIPESSAKQVFKYTIADVANVVGMVQVKATFDWSSGVTSAISHGWFRIQQVSDAAGPAVGSPLIVSSGFGTLAAPVVSGNDVIFGVAIPNNGTAETVTVDMNITLFYDTESNFTWAGLPGTVAHTGASNNNAVTFGQDLLPLTDNAYDIGSASKRVTDIYATNATIQTSTIKVKEQVTPLKSELLAALSSVPSKTYKMKKDVVKESAGEGKARNHVGPVLEDIHASLRASGLDPDDYDFLVGDGGFRPTEVLFLQVEALKARIAALETP